MKDKNIQDASVIIAIGVLIVIGALTASSLFVVFSADQIYLSNVPETITGDVGSSITITGDAHTEWKGVYKIFVDSPSGKHTLLGEYTYYDGSSDWSWSEPYMVSEHGQHKAQISFYNRDPNGAEHTTSASPEIFMILKPSTISIGKPDVQTPRMNNFIYMLFDWIKSFIGFSFGGDVSTGVIINQPYVTALNLEFPILDSDYTDGTYQVAFGGWFVTNDEKTILYDSAFTEIKQSPYVSSIEYTPTKTGKLYLVGIVVIQNYYYSGNEWAMVEHVETKEMQTLNAAIPSPDIVQPTTNITDLINDLWAWIKNLFGVV